MEKERAIVKWNSSMMAILCSGCRTIIKTGVDFTPEEWNYAKSKGCYLEPQYCEKCKNLKMITPKQKAQSIYRDAYLRWCYEISQDKNVLTAKSICEYICNQVLSDMGADRGYEFWTEVRYIILNSNHMELYNS